MGLETVSVVVWRSNRFVVVDKPAGWLTVPGRQGDEDARTCLGKELEKTWGVRIFPVHRLDADVSGVVIFAFDSESHRAANHWFEARWVRKTYEAITEIGEVPPPPGVVEWRSQILRGKKRSYESPHGDWAITRAQLLGLSGQPQKGHWQLEPVTGRPHQLRFELAKRGFPILGDSLYGAKTPWTQEGIALRAIALDFTAVPERLGLPERVEVAGFSI